MRNRSSQRLINAPELTLIFAIFDRILLSLHWGWSDAAAERSMPLWLKSSV
jgi:hypothetical protein